MSFESQSNDLLNFFNKGTYSKCYSCSVHKSKDIEIVKKVNSPILYKLGDNNELLIILEMVEDPNRLEALRYLLRYCNVKDYTIVAGLQCKTKNFELKNPFYATYDTCNVNEAINFEDYKAIITVGRGLYTMTKGDNIPNWKQYSEHLFNPTYFLTGFFYNKKLRVYPAPPLFECFREEPEKGSYNKENFSFWFMKNQIKEAHDHVRDYKPFNFQKYNLVKIKNTSKFFRLHKDKKSLALDTETNGLFHFKDDFKLGCVTISFDGITGYYLSWGDINVDEFNDFLKDKFQIYANGRFDVIGFRKFGLSNAKVDYDVNTAYHILSTVRKRVGLKTQGWDLGFGNYDEELDSYKKKNKIDNYLDIPEPIMFPYATLDPIVTYRSYENTLKLFKEQNKVYKVYKETIIPTIEVFIQAEYHGAFVDLDRVNSIREELIVKVSDLENKVKTHFDFEINVNSGDELAKALEKKGLPDLGRNDRGFYKVGSYELQYWKKIRPEFKELVDDILDFRKFNIILNTFIGSPGEEVKDESKLGFDSSWLDNLFPESVNDFNDSVNTKSLKFEKGLYPFIFSGRVHPNFGVALTDSMRSKCIDLDSIVTCKEGNFTLHEINDKINNKKEKLHALTNDGTYQEIINYYDNGISEVYEVELDNGNKIMATEDHKFYTKRGWVELKNLLENDEILSTM